MPRLWVGRTQYTVAAILVWRWRGEWRHIRVRLA